MANSIASPNMNLPVPVVGQDPSPTWANDLNACLALIDVHNHAAGNGVAITPSGINITSDLPLNNNNLTLVRSIRYQAQPSALSAAIDIGATFITGVDLYYRDLNGVNIQLTASGNPAGTPGNIANLVSPASATYVAADSTFVFQSAATTSANLDGASILLRNLIPASNALTLSPPNAMGANYTLILPSLPTQTNVMTLDASGNIGSITYDQVGQAMTATGSNAIAASMSTTGTDSIIVTMGANGANAIANNRTRATGATVGVGGLAISASCGSFATSSTTYVPVTNLSVTISTSGRPVFIGLIVDGTSSFSGLSSLSIGVASSSVVGIYNGTAFISESNFNIQSNGASLVNTTIPVSSIQTIDIPIAGTYTYSIQIKGSLNGPSNPSNSSLTFAKLIAYEL